ncbi:MAG: hypothetical protein B6244_13815 [Candidatus Cloacimonetes bacterium 4572_55]|nr:MAG: hypothetical protein B6244_13815 [Candidatus Cloacimonetes bacterium 4572_55]
MRKGIVFILLFTLATTSFAMAQSSKFGTVSGRVTDARTGEGLPFVNVLLKGTTIGAATNYDGFYLIEFVPPGTYVIVSTILGYERTELTDISVTAGGSALAHFFLKEEVLESDEEIIVKAERPIIEMNQTTTSRRVGSTEIANMVVDNLTDVVSQQMGIVKSDNELHVRGGRSNETIFMIDGISVADPLAGTSSGIRLSSNAVEEVEVITGVFNPEYGNAMSGVIDVRTKEGGRGFSGSIDYKTDHWGLGTDALSRTGFNTDSFEFTLGGPELITQKILPELGLRIPGTISFFTNGFVKFTDGHLPTTDKIYSSTYGGSRYAPRGDNEWSGLIKTTWLISPNHKLSFSHGQSLSIGQGYFLPRLDDTGELADSGYPYKYQNILENYNTFTLAGNQQTLMWKQNLNTRTFYEMSIGRFFTNLHSDVDGKHWSEYSEHEDLDPVYVIPIDSDQDGVIDSTFTRRGDGFYDYGDNGEWYDHYYENWTMEGSITSQIKSRHQTKFGFSISYAELQLIKIEAPWEGSSGLGRSHDFYRVYPTAGAFYFQDQITFEGMILNAGFRLDYWFPGKYVEDAIADTNVVTLTQAARQQFNDDTYDIFGHRAKANLLPRLGISHPISPQDKIFFSYGHFSQRPRYQYIYSKLKTTSQDTYQLFGNPNLNPQITVHYELGLRHSFDDNTALSVTAFYKDFYDYPTSQQVQSDNPRFQNVDYLMYFNGDFSRSRGIEMEFRRRSGKFFTGSFNFSYSISTGKSSTPNDQKLVAQGELGEKPIKEEFLRWDVPVTFNVFLSFYLPQKHGLKLFGVKPPSEWGFNTRLTGQTGERYTSVTRINEDLDVRSDDRYSEHASFWALADFKIFKNLDLLGMDSRVYLEIKNLLNAKVTEIVNPVTGDAYEPGDEVPVSWDRYGDQSPYPKENPSRYRAPRSANLGFSVKF